MRPIPLRIISLLLAFIIFGQQGFAATLLAFNEKHSESLALLESFDEAAFLAEFDDLRAVESILEKEALSLDELKSSDFSLNVRINPEPALPFEDENNTQHGGCNGFTAFLMGFGCGAIGVIVVFLTTEDKALTNNAFFGCICWSVISLVWQLNYVK